MRFQYEPESWSLFHSRWVAATLNGGAPEGGSTGRHLAWKVRNDAGAMHER
ncbi:hypothetical protein LL912_16100 [Niabella sp. CC-SYL272]|uniref:hypothetical protein n=1 Tax=Niabella agricola TaxID=2891571 RepID=UPI001F476F51|nr:hypothetical protein [Niabella agricola]MCF3110307.1 hypothetical protein [Niabella agricola]